VAEAEHCWYDTSRWSFWVDGLDRVLEVTLAPTQASRLR
jgi:hypothetical protein